MEKVTKTPIAFIDDIKSFVGIFSHDMTIVADTFNEHVDEIRKAQRDSKLAMLLSVGAAAAAGIGLFFATKKIDELEKKINKDDNIDFDFDEEFTDKDIDRNFTDYEEVESD